ncbi:MAG: hypothetical protein INR71_15990, partial [Terriglobus roseus]|nr:hypothetical protein [Terriglobus roseus]
EREPTAGTNFAWLLWNSVKDQNPERAFCSALTDDELSKYRGTALTALNADQRRAAAKVVSRQNVTLMWAGPGNGKSLTAAKIIDGVCLAGKKTLVVASSNLALDQALAKVSANNTGVVRFKGRYNRGAQSTETKPPVTRPQPGETEDAAMGGTADASADEVLDSASWDILRQLSRNIGGSAGQHLYWNKFMNFLEAGVKRAEAAAQEAAAQKLPEPKPDEFQQYSTLLEKLRAKDPNLSKEDRRDLQQEKDTFERHLEALFLREHVNVVFVTTSAAAADILHENFRPDVVIVEEAGQVSVGELAIIGSLYGDHTKHLVMSGDHRQNGPVVLSRGVNEAGACNCLSIFERAWNDVRLADARVQLTVQYRMHPDISAWPNQQFYEGRMEDAPMVKATTADDELVIAYHKSVFGDAWSGNRLLGLDVPGSVFPSTRPPNKKKSWLNKGEAIVCLDYVKGLLSFNHKGKLFDASRVTIITPYSAMKHHLLNEFKGLKAPKVVAIEEQAGSSAMD